APAFFWGGCENKAGKPRLMCETNKTELYALIGEQHADEQHLAKVELAETLERANGARPCAETDLDDVGTRASHDNDCTRRCVRIIRRIADGGADRNVPWNAGTDGFNRGVRQRAQRAGCWVLRVNDVDGEMGAQQRLVLVRHTGKQPRRSARVFHSSEILMLRRRCAAAPSAPSRGRPDRPPKGVQEHPGQ